jgi:nitric oxide reductase large subunit
MTPLILLLAGLFFSVCGLCSVMIAAATSSPRGKSEKRTHRIACFYMNSFLILMIVTGIIFIGTQVL